jgi:hypothetical protein
MQRSLFSRLFLPVGAALMTAFRAASASAALPPIKAIPGLGDSEIAAQAKLWRDEPTVISVLAGVRAPTTGGATNSGLQGPNRPGYDVRLLLGHNLDLDGWSGFVDFSTGSSAERRPTRAISTRRLAFT